MNGRLFGRRPVEALGRDLVLVADEPAEIAPPELADHNEIKERIRAELMGRINPTAAAHMPAHQLRAEIAQIVGEIATETRGQMNEREGGARAAQVDDDTVARGPPDPLRSATHLLDDLSTQR